MKISFSQLIVFNDTLNKTWIAKRDPRVKLLFGIMIIIGDFIFKELIILIILLLTVIILNSLLTSLINQIKLVLSFKYYIALIIIIFYIFNDFKFQIEIVSVIIKLLSIILSFQILNRSTSPDQIIEALIKLKVPPGISWSIGSSLRQATFMIDQLQFVKAIQRKKMGYYKITRIKRLYIKFEEIYVMLSSMFAIAITSSSEFADTLFTRGFKRPHRQLMMKSISFNKSDFIFVLIFIVVPFAFIGIIRSQIFI